jgi:hypothetical protein
MAMAVDCVTVTGQILMAVRTGRLKHPGSRCRRRAYDTALGVMTQVTAPADARARDYSGCLTGRVGQRVLDNLDAAIKCRDLARMRTSIPVPL